MGSPLLFNVSLCSPIRPLLALLGAPLGIWVLAKVGVVEAALARNLPT